MRLRLRNLAVLPEEEGPALRASLCFFNSKSNSLSKTGPTDSWSGRGRLSTEPSMASSNKAVLALS